MSCQSQDSLLCFEIVCLKLFSTTMYCRLQNCNVCLVVWLIHFIFPFYESYIEKQINGATNVYNRKQPSYTLD